jgi:hypothetical protein
MRNRRAGIGLAILALVGVTMSFGATAQELRFTDRARQAEEFIGYTKSIALTPEQEAVKREALSKLKAPCCDDNGLDTCCCPCNLAKTAWGLANHLIAEKHYDAAQVRGKVAEWLEFVNPNEFTGDACYTPGGCTRPIAANGCGGMQGPVVP